MFRCFSGMHGFPFLYSGLEIALYTEVPTHTRTKKNKVFCKILKAFRIKKAYGIQATVSQQTTLTAVND